MDEMERDVDFVEHLREALSRPLADWRELYESFSPLDLTMGERRPWVPDSTDGSRRAAVLVPVLPADEGARIVYTLRTGELRDHAGQISFPGGSIDPDDASPLATALREAEEEIDLSPDLVEVVGELDELYIPPSNFLVSPFVGLLCDGAADLILAPEEVEAIFSTSLKELMSPGSLKKVVWEREGRPHEVPVFAGGGHEIWGATAAITAGLLARLGWKPENATVE